MPLVAQGGKNYQQMNMANNSNQTKIDPGGSKTTRGNDVDAVCIILLLGLSLFYRIVINLLMETYVYVANSHMLAPLQFVVACQPSVGIEPQVGTGRLCQHNFEHNRYLKASSIMLA